MARSKQAKVAQLVEHSTENAGVISSILILGTTGVKPGGKRIEILNVSSVSFFFCKMLMSLYPYSGVYSLVVVVSCISRGNKRKR